MDLIKSYINTNSKYLLLASTLIPTYVLYKCLLKSKTSTKSIEEKNWQKDVVYLYQFPRSKTIPSISPFCLKIETFLRAYNIQYENRFIVAGRSKYGFVPYIELNGEHIADSQLIEEKLTQHFHIESGLSEHQNALSRAVARMVDHHSFFLLYKYKMYDNPSGIASLMLSDLNVPSILHFLLRPIVSSVLKAKSGKRIMTSLGRYSDAEFEMLLRKDLDTLEKIKSNNKFLMGDKISTADFAVFAHLATLFFVPLSSLPKTLLNSEYKSLLLFIYNIRNQYYPEDFEQL